MQHVNLWPNRTLPYDLPWKLGTRGNVKPVSLAVPLVSSWLSGSSNRLTTFLGIQPQCSLLPSKNPKSMWAPGRVVTRTRSPGSNSNSASDAAGGWNATLQTYRGSASSGTPSTKVPSRSSSPILSLCPVPAPTGGAAPPSFSWPLASAATEASIFAAKSASIRAKTFCHSDSMRSMDSATNAGNSPSHSKSCGGGKGLDISSLMSSSAASGVSGCSMVCPSEASVGSSRWTVDIGNQPVLDGCSKVHP
mmetsp:Transcript_111909/g.316243  ORF Transcript_111909/g.316243 Transcript_111909/m.316243 type:complete len:249 (-) Transcript_111909:499-1245(-)